MQNYFANYTHLYLVRAKSLASKRNAYICLAHWKCFCSEAVGLQIRLKRGMKTYRLCFHDSRVFHVRTLSCPLWVTEKFVKIFLVEARSGGLFLILWHFGPERTKEGLIFNGR